MRKKEKESKKLLKGRKVTDENRKRMYEERGKEVIKLGKIETNIGR